MRSILFAAVTSLLALAASAATPKTAVLDVQNMTCGLCPVTVKKALEKLPGVPAVKVDFETKTATVSFDSEKVAATQLVKATTDAGFPSTARK